MSLLNLFALASSIGSQASAALVRELVVAFIAVPAVPCNTSLKKFMGQQNSAAFLVQIHGAYEDAEVCIPSRSL